MTTIRPELIAAKLKAAHNGEAQRFAEKLAQQPRLLEAMFFIENYARLHGGVEGLVERITEAFLDRFQSKAMLNAGVPGQNGKYSLAQCLGIWIEEGSGRYIWDFLDEHHYKRPPRDPVDCTEDILRRDYTPKASELQKLSYGDWLSFFIGRETTIKEAAGNDLQARAMRVGLARFNFQFLKQQCVKAAQDQLAQYLVDCCHEKSVTFQDPWYCVDLVRTLFDFMDQHEATVAGDLAETEVSKIMFRELGFASSQIVPVPIVGPSRFGKTKTGSVWCEMRPGLRRLVTVPESNRERDFHAANADALGIDHDPAITTHKLKELVQFVHLWSRIFLFYDEAQSLIPISYHKGTPPRRLSWVRHQVIDRGLGCAFLATPQSHRETLAAYVQKTGFVMEQWLGRVAPTVILPDSLASADVLAVAKKHFPDMPEPYLKKISARAMQSEGYLKNVELCVKRARFLASESGRTALTIEDVKAAIDQMMPVNGEPGKKTTTQPAQSEVSKPLQPLRNRDSATLKPESPGASANRISRQHHDPQNTEVELVEAVN